MPQRSVLPRSRDVLSYEWERRSGNQLLLYRLRWAYGESGRLLGLAADLVSRKVTVIAAPGGVAAALAAKAATATVPIVFVTGSDPVADGLVVSLNRPGGNVTGITSMNTGLAVKQLGLLQQLLHRDARFAILVNPKNPQTQSVIADVQSPLRQWGGRSKS